MDSIINKLTEIESTASAICLLVRRVNSCYDNACVKINRQICNVTDLSENIRRL